MQYHNGETFGIDVKIKTLCYGRPTTRLITEAMRIEELPEENSLNSKSEWTYIKLPRVSVTWVSSASVKSVKSVNVSKMT